MTDTSADLSEPLVPQDGPWYQRLETKIKNGLQKTILDCSSETPSEIRDITDFITQAKDRVKKDWVQVMLELYDEGGFELNLKEHDEVGSFIDSREAFEKILRSDNYMPLHEIRYHGEPEMCRAGILALSQLNLATFDVLSEWTKKLDDSDFEKIGLPRSIVELYIDINKYTESNIDKIRVAELELTDSPEGQDYSPYYGIKGSEHLYFKRIPDTDTYEAVPLINIENQKQHRTQLAMNLNGLANRVKNELSENKLPITCAGLDAYLQNLSNLFLSTEVDIATIRENWLDIEKQNTALALAGCPIMIVPPSFTDEAGRIETDLLIGFGTTLNSEWREFDEALSQSAVNVANKYNLSEKTVPFINAIILFANGTSHQWIAGGYAMDSAVLIVDNEVEKLVNSPITEMFTNLSSYGKLLTARLISLKAHETGHWPQNTQEIIDRLGAALVYKKLEEARADHKGALEILDLVENGNEIDLKSYIECYLIENAEFLISGYDNMDHDTSSTWYSFSACTMITELFEVGTVKWDGDKITVDDEKLLAGVKAMANVGDEIIKLFQDESTTPEIAKAFVDNYYNKSLNSVDFQNYMDTIRALYK